jgi:hypothetical protein
MILAGTIMAAIPQIRNRRREKKRNRTKSL